MRRPPDGAQDTTRGPTMKWCSAVSERTSLGEAVDDCALKLRDGLDGARPDLVVGFVSAEHGPGYDGVPALVSEALGGRVFIGCSGGGVIGEGREVEHRAGLSLTAAVLPGVRLTPFHVEDGDMPDGDAPPDSWEEMVGTAASAGPHFLLMADPFSVRGEHLVMGLDYAFPSSVKIGGLASGGRQPGANSLFLDDRAHRSGAVGVTMHGDIAVDTVVAQGCRPIGQVMHITSCERHELLGLDGRTPFEVLRELFATLSDRDRELAQHSLFLGVVMDELIYDPGPGDFLIRNIVGLDPRRGGLGIAEMLKEGQTVQFHLRDAQASIDDLRALLDRYVDERPVHGDAGALLFSCLGRGSYLYGRPDQDTDLFRSTVGGMPLTGFFCNGEIGQVRGSTYLHGYTSSFGIFRPRDSA